MFLDSSFDVVLLSAFRHSIEFGNRAVCISADISQRYLQQNYISQKFLEIMIHNSHICRYINKIYLQHMFVKIPQNVVNVYQNLKTKASNNFLSCRPTVLWYMQEHKSSIKPKLKNSLRWENYKKQNDARKKEKIQTKQPE